VVGVKKEPISLPPGTIYGLRTHQKCFIGRGFTPHPAGRVHSAPWTLWLFFFWGGVRCRKEREAGREGDKGKEGRAGGRKGGGELA